MNNKIKDSFSGMLNLCESGKGYDSFFSYNNQMITILPLFDASRKEVDLLNYEADPKKKWMYGFSEDNCSVAFL